MGKRICGRDVRVTPASGRVGCLGGRAKDGDERAFLVSYNSGVYLVHKATRYQAIHIALYGICLMYYDQAGGCNASAGIASVGLLAARTA